MKNAKSRSADCHFSCQQHFVHNKINEKMVMNQRVHTAQIDVLDQKGARGHTQTM